MWMIKSFLIGLVIGLLYFGGLYFSTQKLDDVKSPGFLMIGSFILRMVILIFGLYYLAQTNYQSVLLGFVGIMLVRVVLVTKVKDS